METSQRIRTENNLTDEDNAQKLKISLLRITIKLTFTNEKLLIFVIPLNVERMQTRLRKHVKKRHVFYKEINKYAIYC